MPFVGVKRRTLTRNVNNSTPEFRQLPDFFLSFLGLSFRLFVVQYTAYATFYLYIPHHFILTDAGLFIRQRETFGRERVKTLNTWGGINELHEAQTILD